MIWVFAIQKPDHTLSIHCIHLQEGIECQPSKPRNLTVLIETRSVFFYSSSLFIHNVTALIETIRENRRPDIAKTNQLQLWGASRIERLWITARPVNTTAARARQQAENAKRSPAPNMKQDPIKVIVTIDWGKKGICGGGRRWAGAGG